MHVRTVAALEDRTRWVAKEEAIDEREAAKRIRRRDDAVARYLGHYYRVRWNDPLLYHLILNTGFLGEAKATRLILALAAADSGAAAGREGVGGGCPGHIKHRRDLGIVESRSTPSEGAPRLRATPASGMEGTAPHQLAARRARVRVHVFREGSPRSLATQDTDKANA